MGLRRVDGIPLRIARGPFDAARGGWYDGATPRGGPPLPSRVFKNYDSRGDINVRY